MQAIDPFLDELKRAQLAGQQVLAANRQRASSGSVPREPAGADMTGGFLGLVARLCRRLFQRADASSAFPGHGAH